MADIAELKCLGSGLSPEEEAKVRVAESDVQAQGWPADYKLATVRDIPSNAFTYANRPHDEDIDRLVIHFTQGMNFGPIAFGPGGLTPYGVSQDGRVDQYIQERHIAYHAANWDWNKHSIGIEHVGYGRPQDWTTALYEASAKLSADICKRHKIPVDRAHIKGHSEIPGATHTDVGRYFDWVRYLNLIKKYMGGTPTPAPKPPSGVVLVRIKSALPAGKAIHKLPLAEAKKEQERLLENHGIETAVEESKAPAR